MNSKGIPTNTMRHIVRSSEGRNSFLFSGGVLYIRGRDERVGGGGVGRPDGEGSKPDPEGPGVVTVSSGTSFAFPQLLTFTIIIIMYIHHALINALSAHMVHINLNLIFYTHVEHSPTKTICMKYFIYIWKNKHCWATHHIHTNCRRNCNRKYLRRGRFSVWL